MVRRYGPKGMRQIGGAIHKALIILTLGAQFAFAPLRVPQTTSEKSAAAVVEMPELANAVKVSWLDPSGLRGQGEKSPIQGR